jgi:broad specificity phosphatase PhoE
MADKKKTLAHIVLRHGQTTLNVKKCFRSRLDPDLSEKGKSQAKEAAEAMRGEDIKVERVISSPLKRSVQTADAVAEEYGLDATQDRGLISFDLGFMGGKDKEDYAELLDYFIDHPKSKIPDGEALDDLENRTFEFFDRELRDKKLTVFVTHNSNIVTLENLIKGMKEGRPESSETSVEPGGSLGVYVDDDGKYSVEVLFGKAKEAEYGA